MWQKKGYDNSGNVHVGGGGGGGEGGEGREGGR